MLTGSNRVIIIDKAQHLSAKVINYLRSIPDCTENTVGMAFVGNEEIYLKMKENVSYKQLRSRIGNRAPLKAEEVEFKDIQIIFEEAQLDDENQTFWIL